MAPDLTTPDRSTETLAELFAREMWEAAHARSPKCESIAPIPHTAMQDKATELLNKLFVHGDVTLKHYRYAEYDNQPPGWSWSPRTPAQTKGTP